MDLRIWIVLLATFLSGVSQASRPSCENGLVAVEAPVEEPTVAPPAPVAPPRETPRRSPHPQSPPRRAPNPRPGREVVPTKDPKNLDALSFFKVKGFPTQLFPRELLKDWETKFAQEKLQTEKGLQAVGIEFGKKTEDAFARLERLGQEIEKLEASRKESLLSFIQDLMRKTFGRDILKNFERFDFGEQAMTHLMPTPVAAPVGEKPKRSLTNFFRKQQAPGRPQAVEQRERPAAVDQNQLGEWEIIRREVYNMLAAAWGWRGSEALLWSDASYFQERFPELNLPMTQFHYLRRYGDLLFFADEFSRRGFPKVGPGGPQAVGQECVECQGKKVEDDFGDQQIELGATKAYAVAKNSWLLAHEGFKAAFQIRTALEATPRMTLSAAERAKLRDLEIGPQNEFRQLLFGRYAEKQWSEILKVIVRQKFKSEMSQDEYFTLTERVFSYDISLFRWLLQNAFKDGFREDPEAVDQAIQRFGEFGIFDGLRGEG